MSDYERIAEFLMLDNGQNLRDFKGSGEDYLTSGVNKTTVVNKCVRYFEEKGVKSRSVDQLRKRIGDLLGPKYRSAHRIMTATGAGSLNDDPEQLQKALEEECPGFLSFKSILGDTGMDSNATCDSSQPLDLSFLDKHFREILDEGEDDSSVSSRRASPVETLPERGKKRARRNEVEKDLIAALDKNASNVAKQADNFMVKKLALLERQTTAEELKCLREAKIKAYDVT